MTYYTLGPAFASRLRSKTLRRGAPLALLAVAAGLYVALADAGGEVGLTLFVLLPVVAVAVAVGLRRGYQIQLERWEGFRVGLSDDRLLWHIGGEEGRIRRADIEGLREVPGEGLLVEGPARTVLIPLELEGYAELVDRLGGAPVQQRRPPVVYTTPVGLATLVGFTVVMVSEAAWVVVPVGAVLVGVLVSSWAAIARTPGVDPRVRRAAAWSGLPILAVIVRMVLSARG